MQAFHKQQKAKEIKKSKAAALKQRTEKLAKRNPHRIAQQIESLKAAVESGHARPHDRKILADLERDLAAVKKARKAAGIEDREFRPQEARKRKRDGEGKGPEGRAGDAAEESDSGESTSSSVADIPLPPGPLPPRPGEKREEPKISYESKPVMRDLRKEAAAFVPAAVKRRLEMEKKANEVVEQGQEDERGRGTEEGLGGVKLMVMNAAPDVDMDVESEMRRFEAEVEEVEDEEA